jgi:hypothetical protein
MGHGEMNKKISAAEQTNWNAGIMDFVQIVRG